MKLYELVIYQIYSQYHILFSSLLGSISLGQTVLLKQKYTKNRSLEFIKAIKNFCLLFYIQYSFSIQHSSIDSKTTELFRMIQEIYISLHSSLQILTTFLSTISIVATQINHPKYLRFMHKKVYHQKNQFLKLKLTRQKRGQNIILSVTLIFKHGFEESTKFRSLTKNYYTKHFFNILWLEAKKEFFYVKSFLNHSKKRFLFETLHLRNNFIFFLFFYNLNFWNNLNLKKGLIFVDQKPIKYFIKNLYFVWCAKLCSKSEVTLKIHTVSQHFKTHSWKGL